MRDLSNTADAYAKPEYVTVTRAALDPIYTAPVARELDNKRLMQSGLPLYWDGDSPKAVGGSAGRTTQLRIKRLMDVTLASLALIALAPLLIIVALAIKLTSPGPVLFKQTREGLNGELFATYKFRSMRTDQCDVTGVAQTQVNDPRVTPIGRFIRKTSIDELPQLLNVLRGDMSLVGPRPHVPGMKASGMLYSELVPYYDRRLEMAPGITGWAQANGLRGATGDARTATARVDHDIAYIQNYSLALDIKIMFKTLYNEFITGSGH